MTALVSYCWTCSVSFYDRYDVFAGVVAVVVVVEVGMAVVRIVMVLLLLEVGVGVLLK